MSDPFNGEPFPKAVGYAVIGMLGIIITMTAIVSYQKRQVMRENPLTAYATTEALRHVDIRFETRPDGAMCAFDVHTGRELAVYANDDTASFARGVIKSLARMRQAESMGLVTPMRLTAWSDGRLSLFDPQTNGLIELSSFGTNKAVFVSLMEEAGALRRLKGGHDVATTTF
ncbi:MAG: photosynthetic complex assembly protein PuhC [Myxococcota bacterium]